MVEAIEARPEADVYLSSEIAEKLLNSAAGEVERQWGVNYITPEFILAALIEDGSANHALEGQGITVENVRGELVTHIKPQFKPPSERVRIENPKDRLVQRTRLVFQYAHERALEQERGMNAEDVLYGICYEGDNNAVKILKNLHFDWNLHEARGNFVTLVNLRNELNSPQG